MSTYCQVCYSSVSVTYETSCHVYTIGGHIVSDMLQQCQACQGYSSVRCNWWVHSGQVCCSTIIVTVVSVVIGGYIVSGMSHSQQYQACRCYDSVGYVILSVGTYCQAGCDGVRYVGNITTALPRQYHLL